MAFLNNIYPTSLITSKYIQREAKASALFFYWLAEDLQMPSLEVRQKQSRYVKPATIVQRSAKILGPGEGELQPTSFGRGADRRVENRGEYEIQLTVLRSCQLQPLHFFYAIQRFPQISRPNTIIISTSSQHKITKNSIA